MHGPVENHTTQKFSVAQACIALGPGTSVKAIFDGVAAALARGLMMHSTADVERQNTQEERANEVGEFTLAFISPSLPLNGPGIEDNVKGKS